MRPMSRIVPIASTVLVAFGAAAAVAEDMEVDATIQTVNEDEHSLTVKIDETGDMRTFRVGDGTEITFSGNRDADALTQLRSGFEDLRAGQEVTLSFDGDTVDEEWVLLRFITIS